MAEPDTLTHLTEVFQSVRPRLTAYLRAAFPRLANEVEDILQNIWLEVRQKAVGGDFSHEGQWQKWFWLLVRSRAIDRLRRIEGRLFVDLAKNHSQGEGCDSVEPIDDRSSPSRHVMERERRHRQGLLLSEVLGEFCRWCEKKPQRLAIKEAYERSLHGQNAGQIAQAMQVTPESVYQWLHQARQWIRNRIREKDVHRSVFLTMYGGH